MPVNFLLVSENSYAWKKLNLKKDSLNTEYVFILIIILFMNIVD